MRSGSDWALLVWRQPEPLGSLSACSHDGLLWLAAGAVRAKSSKPCAACAGCAFAFPRRRLGLARSSTSKLPAASRLLGVTPDSIESWVERMPGLAERAAPADGPLGGVPPPRPSMSPMRSSSALKDASCPSRLRLPVPTGSPSPTLDAWPSPIGWRLPSRVGLGVDKFVAPEGGSPESLPLALWGTSSTCGGTGGTGGGVLLREGLGGAREEEEVACGFLEDDLPSPSLKMSPTMSAKEEPEFTRC